MEKYYLNCSEVEKLIEQTGAEVMDCIEGVLVDSLLFTFTNKNGVEFTCAAFEHYCNPWSSDIETFLAHTEQDTAKIWEMWDKLKKYYEEESAA